MSEKVMLPRYQVWFNYFKSTRAYAWWTSMRRVSATTWYYTRGTLWTLSAVGIVLLLPLLIETTIDGELKAMELSSQLGPGMMNPDVQYRPY